MNDIQNIEVSTITAHTTYEKIVGLRKSINTNFWELVKNLKEARENRHWVLLDCENWKSYLAQPEIDLNEKTVDRYLTIYNRFKDNHLLDHVPVIDIDIGKLAVVAPYLTSENAEELLEKAKTLSRSDLREEMREEQYKNLPVIELPTDKYDVIYADPPWQYRFSETESREIENQYPTMELDDIKKLPVPSADNAVLFLWATAPKLLEALEVLVAWGFDYRTCAVWDKELIGMGYWFRGQHELLLVGVKGNMPTPEETKRISSVYREKRGKHSVKPTFFYELIESYFPNGKYIELFSRNKHNEKWSVWGNQV